MRKYRKAWLGATGGSGRCGAAAYRSLVVHTNWFRGNNARDLKLRRVSHKSLQRQAFLRLVGLEKVREPGG
jgi:hypothetical protein